MKRLPLIAMLTASVFMTACSFLPLQVQKTPTAITEALVPAPGALKPERDANVAADRVQIQDEKGSVVVQKVEFRSGVSSASVERLAQRFGCTGSTGAGLMTQKGPVEVYRMTCENGTTFMAQCELRQCRPMRR